MTSPFFGFGLPGGRGAGGAIFCFFAGLTHCSIFTMSISRFRPCRVKTTMPAREPWARSQASMSKSGGASAPFGHSTRPFVRNHLSSSSSSIAPFVQGWSFRFRAARKASARFASSALSAGTSAEAAGAGRFVPEAGAAAGAGAGAGRLAADSGAAAAGRFVPDAGAGAGAGAGRLAAGAARGDVVAAGAARGDALKGSATRGGSPLTHVSSVVARSAFLSPCGPSAPAMRRPRLSKPTSLKRGDAARKAASSAAATLVRPASATIQSRSAAKKASAVTTPAGAAAAAELVEGVAGRFGAAGSIGAGRFTAEAGAGAGAGRFVADVGAGAGAGADTATGAGRVGAGAGAGALAVGCSAA